MGKTVKKPSYAALKREHKQLLADHCERITEVMSLKQGLADAVRGKESAVKEAQDKAKQLANLEGEVSVAHHLLDGMGVPRQQYGVTLSLVQRLAALPK